MDGIYHVERAQALTSQETPLVVEIVAEHAKTRIAIYFIRLRHVDRYVTKNLFFSIPLQHKLRHMSLGFKPYEPPTQPTLTISYRPRNRLSYQMALLELRTSSRRIQHRHLANIGNFQQTLKRRWRN
jgi:hypothetical protein